MLDMEGKVIEDGKEYKEILDMLWSCYYFIIIIFIMFWNKYSYLCKGCIFENNLDEKCVIFFFKIDWFFLLGLELKFYFYGDIRTFRVWLDFN